MTGNQEFEPLDELFRKTFQDLPDTPTTSGWDTPSPRVWQRVQGQIKPPTTGWTALTWSVLAVLAVLLGTGWYFAYGKAQPAPRPVPAPTERPAIVPPTVATPPEISPVTPTQKMPVASPTTKFQPAATEPQPNPPVNNSTPRGVERTKAQQAMPLPGTKPVSPNSTEREKSKDGQEK